MSFFDGLPASGPPAEPLDDTLELGTYAPGSDEEFAPSHWFVPAQLAQVAEAGAGPDVRIMLTGWQVWPGSVTMRLSVFLRRIRAGGRTSPYGPPDSGALRCGLLLADGRKVTTLDGPPLPVAGPAGPTLRLSGGSGGASTTNWSCTSRSCRPPASPSWSSSGRTSRYLRPSLSSTPDRCGRSPAKRGRSGRTPRRRTPGGGRADSGFLGLGPGPAVLLARPSGPEPPQPWSPPVPDAARDDWRLLAPFHWRDTGLVLARLEAVPIPAPSCRATLARPRCTWPRPTVAWWPSPRCWSGARWWTRGTARPHPLWHAVCHGAGRTRSCCCGPAPTPGPRSSAGAPRPTGADLRAGPLFAELPGRCR
ncbi:hypothetical protein O1L55_00960 [Streptomyces albulus]|nr:hypothetical protein [Streptomyces noursei]